MRENEVFESEFDAYQYELDDNSRSLDGLLRYLKFGRNGLEKSIKACQGLGNH